MPLRDRSGQRWQPSGKSYVVAATKVCSRFFGTCRDLGCTYSVHIQTRQVFLGRFNEFRLHRFSSPPFGSPFIPSPSHTFVSSFLSCPPVFMSGHLILFFVCAHMVPALVCTCTSTYISTQVLGRPGLYNEVGFIGCPCALGSPFISTTRTFVPSRPLVMSSFSCLLCAHTCTLALTLVSRLPSGRRVCVTLGVRGIRQD